MSKAILVIDMPKSCKDCDIMFPDDHSDYCPWEGATTDVYDYIQNNTKPDWCPLKEMPEKRSINIALGHDIDIDCAIGYNSCIDEIVDMFKDEKGDQ